MCHRNSFPKEITNKENGDAVLLLAMVRLINEHRERQRDQNAQVFRDIANRVSGDSTAPISTAARRSFNSLQFQPIHSLRSAPSTGPD
jgi:ubiquinone biosynthesis protein UbiJ